MTPHDEVRLRHMLDAARKVVHYAGGRSQADLEDDEMRLLAIIRLLEILGEAAKNVSAGVRADHGEIPWRAIAGARDRLIHGYFNIDLAVIS